MSLTLKSAVMFFLTMMFVLQTNCVLFDKKENLPGQEEYYRLNKIPINNQTQRVITFNSYSLEKQIDIYLFAMCCVNPSDVVFREYLSVGGEDKIAKLSEVIKMENSFMNKAYLIAAIDEIDRNCKCVANNPKIMETLKLSETAPNPNDSEAIRGWKETYKLVLLSLKQRNIKQAQ